MRRRLVTLSLLLPAIAALAGCGQKGPLFLPQPRPTTTAPASATSTTGPAVPVTVVAPPSPAASSG